jgi:type IV pilus assembly protein PilC
MPRFDYNARGARGEPFQGVITATDPREAARLLRADGKFVVNLNAAADEARPKDAVARPITIGGGRVKGDDVIFFASQMSVMVDTGVSITDALESIIEQTTSPAFKSILEKVLADVQTGTPFSVALSKHPKAFKPLLVNLIKASEASGKLGAMLDRCAGYLSAQRDARKKITGAMTYPAFLMFMAVAVVVVLLGVLMPRFTKIYAGKEQFLPKPTKILMAISDTMTDNWVLLLGGAIAILAGSIFFFRSNRGVRPGHWLLLHLPLGGRMLHKAYLARSLRTLGTLIDSGVSMLDAVSITRAVVPNRFFQDMWDDVDTRVQRGEQLTAPLLDTPLVPRPVTQMIRAGERSGHLGAVLDRVSTFLESDLDQTIKRVTQMIEPIMIMVMGAIIGSIVIALLMPIFTIGRVMGH